VGGYEEKTAKLIIAEYQEHLQKRGRLISNNILAAMVIIFMVCSAVMQPQCMI
jgi:hypothetical protein